jgi:hypothetical protein
MLTHPRQIKEIQQDEKHFNDRPVREFSTSRTVVHFKTASVHSKFGEVRFLNPFGFWERPNVL